MEGRRRAGGGAGVGKREGLRGAPPPLIAIIASLVTVQSAKYFNSAL